MVSPLQVSGNTLWAHYTRSAERADYVSSAFRATAGEARDPFRCGGCGAGWGWSPPHAGISCCDKPPPPQRLPPPRRFTDAGPASCGLGGGGAALQLAFWSEYGDVDPRYALRRESTREYPRLPEIAREYPRHALRRAHASTRGGDAGGGARD